MTKQKVMGVGASIAEPPPRWGHFSAPVEGHLCVSGGCCTKGSTKEKGSLAGQTLFRGCEEYSLVKLHRLTCFCTFSNYQNGVGPSDYFDVIKLARAF